MKKNQCIKNCGMYLKQCVEELNAYIGKRERSQIKDLNFVLENKKQIRSKARNLSSKDKSIYQ